MWFMVWKILKEIIGVYNKEVFIETSVDIRLDYL